MFFVGFYTSQRKRPLVQMTQVQARNAAIMAQALDYFAPMDVVNIS